MARALPGLPQISEAFREGRVSCSKVRAMTRVATPENESCLLNMSRYGTASQFCRARCGSALARDTRTSRPQAASSEIDEDGYWVLKGRFTPEQGAVIRQALEKIDGRAA